MTLGNLKQHPPFCIFRCIFLIKIYPPSKWHLSGLKLRKPSIFSMLTWIWPNSSTSYIPHPRLYQKNKINGPKKKKATVY